MSFGSSHVLYFPILWWLTSFVAPFGQYVRWLACESTVFYLNQCVSIKLSSLYPQWIRLSHESLQKSKRGGCLWDKWKVVLFWDCHVWPQREVWVRKVILYRDTQWELLLSCVRKTELDWSTLEVPANYVHTHLGGMWVIVPVNREDVFQVGCKECTGHWE